MGWSGIKNGKLLELAGQNNFDVFITADRNLSFQQNVPKLAIAVIVLQAPGIQLRHTLPLMSKALALLPSISPGSVTVVG